MTPQQQTADAEAIRAMCRKYDAGRRRRKIRDRIVVGALLIASAACVGMIAGWAAMRAVVNYFNWGLLAGIAFSLGVWGMILAVAWKVTK